MNKKWRFNGDEDVEEEEDATLEEMPMKDTNEAMTITWKQN